MIYEFHWDDGKERELIEIKSTSAGAEEPEVIEKLLDKYRDGNDEYNIDDWCSFLVEQGYSVKLIKKDYSLYF